MDDNRFDDIIKGKVDGYEEPGFDPSALASLHHKMATVSVLPWYTRYRTELLLGTVFTILTLFIIYNQWYWNNQSRLLLENELSSLRTDHNSELDRLNEELIFFKNKTPDTILVAQINERMPPSYYSLLERVAELEAGEKTPTLEGAIYLGSENDLPPEIIRLLKNAGYLKTNGTEVYISSTNPSPRLTRKGVALLPREPAYYLVFAQPKDGLLEDTERKKNMVKISAKTARELNKHYRKGIGIKVGPSVDFARGNFKIGQDGNSVGFGINGEFTVSPSLSIESGATYRQVPNRIASDFTGIELPGHDPTLGTLSHVDFDMRVLDIPINLKYRYQISGNANVFASAGYSAILYLTEDLEYTYNLPGDQNGAIIKLDRSTEKIASYPGMVNFNVGYNRRLVNNKSWETSLFYQKGLGDKGLEKNDVDFFGIRSVYWFTVKE